MSIYKPEQSRAHAISRLERSELEEFPALVASEEFPSLDELIEDAEELSGTELQILREQMLEEARNEGENTARRAYEEGLAQGQAAGRAEFDRTVGESAVLLRHAAETIVASHTEFLESLMPQVLDLVRLVSESVIQRELRVDKELIHRTVRHALEKVARRRRLRIVVNPDDLTTLRDYRITLLEDFDGMEEMEIEARSSIAPGGCIVEAEQVQVDAQIETLLANVLEGLTG